MRCTLSDGKIVVRSENAKATWPMQAQDALSVLCAERQNDFPWYVSQYAFFRPIGLESGAMARWPAKKQASQTPTASGKTTPGQTASITNNWEESTVVAQEALSLISKRIFLQGVPDSLDGKDLKGGARLDPECKSIHGYAWDKNNIAEPALVICFLNDKAFHLTFASQNNYRWDDGKMIISKNRNGFHIVTEPLPLKEGDEIDIYFLREKKRLSGCPIIVKDGKLVLFPDEPGPQLSSRSKLIFAWRLLETLQKLVREVVHG